MKNIEKYFPSANEALVSCNIVNEKSHQVNNSVYGGQLAGFGPAVILSGLSPTVSSYLDSKNKILDCIAKVVDIAAINDGEQLLQYCLRNNDDISKMSQLREELINASVALKMMIRTYRTKKDKDES